MSENKFTPRAEEVLRLSQEAAEDLGHGYVGSEHLLLGLIREEEGIAHRVLSEFGVTDEMSYRTDGSNAQQRAHAIERGPLTDDEQVRLVAAEGRERLYAIGQDGYTDWIVAIDRRGRIRLMGA